MGEITEKQRRIYYQSIVYEVCKLIDAHRDNIAPAFEPLLSGTVEKPCRDVQDAVTELIAEIERAHA